ncbi:hypothetical protein ONZ45_g8523 [Pleurotus djamor]|nr:hypothetical protein ONZ45_g8523 [Pleurotus djamor]
MPSLLNPGKLTTSLYSPALVSTSIQLSGGGGIRHKNGAYGAFPLIETSSPSVLLGGRITGGSEGDKFGLALPTPDIDGGLDEDEVDGRAGVEEEEYPTPNPGDDDADDEDVGALTAREVYCQNDCVNRGECDCVCASG